jgi:hypothetical protein
MRTFDYIGVGVLIVCMLAGTKALSVDTTSMMIAVADMAEVVAPDTEQSPRQPSPEDEEDLLNTLD